MKTEKFDLVRFGARLNTFFRENTNSVPYGESLYNINNDIGLADIETIVDITLLFRDKSLRFNTNNEEVARRIEIIRKNILERMKVLIKKVQTSDQKGEALAQRFEDLLGHSNELAEIRRKIERNPRIFDK